MDLSGNCKLIVLQGPSVGRTFELTLEEVVIGREAGVELQIPSPAVSRRHSRLVFRNGDFVLEDLGSSNGTYLNGRQLSSPTVLSHGDKIGLGQAITLEFDATQQDVYATQAKTYSTQVIQDVQEQVAEEVVNIRNASSELNSISRETDSEKHSEDPALAATMLGEEIDPDSLMKTPSLVISVAGVDSDTYTLTHSSYSLGRQEDNDIVVNSRIVSKHHARLEKAGNEYQLVVLPDASNPCYFQGRPVSEPLLLKDGDTIRIGGVDPGMMVTMVYHGSTTGEGKVSQKIELGENSLIQIGRHPENEVVLDSPLISRFHAQIERIGQRYRLRDLRSANGTFVNGQRVEGEIWLGSGDNIRIGPYRLVMGDAFIDSFDESSGLHVDAVGLNKWVRKDLNILQNISLVFQPREFIVVVGQSGGGKSTLVDAIAGYRPATHGEVRVNDIDVYRHFDAVRNDIGFVPQRDIIHTELTVYQALDYAAQLRMPPDTSAEERKARVMEVLEDLDLAHRKDVQISGLSGGQQKRVSIGVELITKPGLFFLDEPTSGLDPGTETSLMQLMRRLADQGRTIVLITHATKNVMLADKVVFLARGGHLAWFGPPDEALKYFDTFRSDRERRAVPMEFDQIYAILDDPSKGNPQDWAKRFREHSAYKNHVLQPLAQHGYELDIDGNLLDSNKMGVEKQEDKAPRPKVRGGNQHISGLRQFLILSARNIRILTRDRFSMVLMLAAAPLVGLLDFVLSSSMGRNLFDYQEGNLASVTTSLFLLTVYGVMVGGLSQMREIVKEQEIYRRERLVNLKIFPYVLSKIWVAALLALYQAAAYIIMHYLAFDMPGGVSEFLLIFVTLTLSTMAGMMLGLFASVLAPNANAAPLVVILLMLPQIVLGGALIPLPDAISGLTSTRWAFQALMGITGGGSDIAADACWSLPEETRLSMTDDEKIEFGCHCLGPNALKQEFCNVPGLGQFYDPAVDQPPPQEPAPVGDPPSEPVLPQAPDEPEDQTDNLAMAQYLEELKQYQAEVDRINADYKAQLDDYQAQADIYQQEVITYQQSLAEWQIARNAAIGKAEGWVDSFQLDFGWTLLDKSDSDTYFSGISKTWLSQGVIILVLFSAILVLMRRKDRTT